ncbi:FAD-binding and (Fe-S)-binding domain-containing protein [Terasakiispira papahanaumokuakeensis]|uniref:FAD-binding and (Fe-S)-binding domain-containing protein n=1 Tax=Terasakiispira papahanaumokuakeensis TaxID=197479 RepID=UPI000A074C12|nr:FAD-binding and (Fe-S)-binding domain-containing protein [Terasakiispira papahanaumokuakeensis]
MNRASQHQTVDDPQVDTPQKDIQQTANTLAYGDLIQHLRQRFPEERLIHDPLRTLAYGTDASFYRLIPQLVARVEQESEVQYLLKACAERGLPITFRAAGTSLSGQAVTDSVLMQLGNGWNTHEILRHGDAIRLGPGVIGAQANAWLKPLDRKIGPDPASINSCMIGGIAANNASGMCCGTAQNSYRTVEAMRIILADGTLLDTADSDSRAAFMQSHGDLLERLRLLGETTQANTPLADKIRHKYRLKNTTGYALNALVDFTDPFDILMHLLIGSEGTLGFISQITYSTVPEHRYKAAALMYFPDIATACRATVAMKSSPVSAVELLDRAALRAVEDMPGMPEDLKTLPEQATALLVDVRGADAQALHTHIETVQQALGDTPTLSPVTFTTDQSTYELYWKIRKGTFPAVGAERVIGTTVIIEDVAFPLASLAEGVTELRAIFDRYGYDEAILFGHALEGNLHFVFTQGFDDPKEVARYEALMDDVAELVAVRYGGSLKAEHGTGRNMAPYVELEWGAEGYALMKTIKHIFDPTNLLNPDVILSDNPKLHIQNLKPLPPAHDLVDRCIECGFCEAVCPSRRLTLTPRQRIVLWRELSRLESQGQDPERQQQLREAYQYQGIETCAADGLCSTRCPVGINTGDLVREIRHQQNQSLTSKGQWLADHFAGITQIARVGLKAARLGHGLLGTAGMKIAVNVVNKLSHNAVGHWSPAMPTAATPITSLQRKLPQVTDPTAPAVVYLPSCAARVMGAAKDDPDRRSLEEVIFTLLHRAGYRVIVPEAIDNLCCGMAFQSKGLFDTANQKRSDLIQALYQASEQGRWPIICDTSPCAMRLKETPIQEREDSTTATALAALTLMEPVQFVHDYLLDHLTLTPKQERIALHITCSTTRMGLADRMLNLAQRCAQDVVVPESITCCGFAGDKGFKVPELNASSLQDLKREVSGCQRGFSNSRTCEIGLTEHGGIPYQSILYLVDEVSRPT